MHDVHELLSEHHYQPTDVYAFDADGKKVDLAEVDLGGDVIDIGKLQKELKRMKDVDSVSIHYVIPADTRGKNGSVVMIDRREYTHPEIMQRIHNNLNRIVGEHAKDGYVGLFRLKTSRMLHRGKLVNVMFQRRRHK